MSLAREDFKSRLAILADAAKYDASCASSGSAKRDSRSGGIGSTEGMGICHSYAPDGRCISLLKILLTNLCVYDCLYCVNRVSSDTPRARFTPEEVADLTLAFYKRNYIEGLFLSSGIVRSRPTTRWSRSSAWRGSCARRTTSAATSISRPSPNAIPRSSRRRAFGPTGCRSTSSCRASRASRNTRRRRTRRSIRGAMAGLRLRIDEAKEEKTRSRRAPQFAPAGQSTQMIVGADASSDVDILRTSLDALRQLQSQARLLFRVQSHPGRRRETAAGEAAADARAPALSGRLAVCASTAFPSTRSRKARAPPTVCCRSTWTPSSRGRSSIARCFPST